MFAWAPGSLPTGKTGQRLGTPFCFQQAPVRLNQRFAFRPSLTLRTSLAANPVISLEPRTLRQPGKLKNCRRTSLFYSSQFLSQTETASFSPRVFRRLHRVHRDMPENSAAGAATIRRRTGGAAVFAGILDAPECDCSGPAFPVCENHGLNRSADCPAGTKLG